MTNQEQNNFEAELRSMKPAKPPQELMVRLRTAKRSEHRRSSETVRPSSLGLELRSLLRWLIPTTALVLVTAVIIWRSNRSTANRATDWVAQRPDSTSQNVPSALKADEVKIDQELVSSFDAVARLPSGEPVRFRCETWLDQVAMTDKERGLFVANRAPRIEVVAVGFESY